MDNEFIELANTTLAQLSGLIFNQLQNPDTDKAKKSILNELEKTVLYDKYRLYSGTDEEREEIYDRVRTIYAPFLKENRTNNIRQLKKMDFKLEQLKERLIG